MYNDSRTIQEPSPEDNPPSSSVWRSEVIPVLMPGEPVVVEVFLDPDAKLEATEHVVSAKYAVPEPAPRKKTPKWKRVWRELRR